MLCNRRFEISLCDRSEISLRWSVAVQSLCDRFAIFCIRFEGAILSLQSYCSRFELLSSRVVIALEALCKRLFVNCNRFEVALKVLESPFDRFELLFNRYVIALQSLSLRFAIVMR